MISAVIFVVAAIAIDLCDQCCLAYQCSDYKSSTKCASGYDYQSGSPCLWENNNCRVATCADAPSKVYCDAYQPNCQWRGAACVEVNSCGNWSGAEYISDCINQFYGDTACIPDAEGNICSPYTFTCADLTNGLFCELLGLKCKWNDQNTCVAASSCSAWDSDMANCNHQFGDDYCYEINGKCTNVTSCSSWTVTNASTCEAHYYGNSFCVWKNNACRSAACSDYSAQTTCESANGTIVQYCKWKNDACVHVETSCEAKADGKTICETSSACTYLSGACPTPPGDLISSASGIFVPMAAVVLALLVSLFW